LFGGNPYKQHNSGAYRRRNRRNMALLGVSLLGIIMLGVFVNPFNDNFQQNPQKAVINSEIGYSLGGTPVVVDSSPQGAWPSGVYPTDTFAKQWQRLDSPIKAGRTNRNWTFSAIPGPTFLEPYQNGLRLVQYWDKARMQIEDSSKPSQLTYGSLARELISGKAQLGDNDYISLDASYIPVVGQIQSDNPAPTYAALAGITTLVDGQNKAERQTGLVVTSNLNQAGQSGSGSDGGVATYNIKNSNYIDQTGHNIPSVFWDYLNRSGPVALENDYPTERLFNWTVQFGQPLSEAYWIKALINGSVQDVLIQVYEKQILTYIPSYKADIRVDSVNIGRHYYEWRYPGSGFGIEKPVNNSPNLPLTARLTIGNESIMRTLVVENGHLSRNTLINRLTGQVYADLRPFSNISGFSVRLVGPNNGSFLINGDQFTLNGYSLSTWNNGEKILELKGQLTFLGQPLNLHFYYRAVPGQNFLEKWIGLEPNEKLADWHVRLLSIEDTAVIKQLRPAAPTPEEESLPLLVHTEKTNNVPGGAIFTDVLVHENSNEGLYFFSASPTGGEYATDKRVIMMQEDYQSLAEGFTSGKAVLGIYTGRVDLGFKRFGEYIQNNYSQMAGKRQPVWYSTWYPFTNQINQELLLTQLDKMKELGIYDVLHIDAGWEGGNPLQVNTTRFPQGLKPLADKAAAQNMSLGLWINPFSISYEKYTAYSTFFKSNPAGLIKGLERQVAGRDYTSGPLGVNSDYYFYVRERLIDLVQNYNVRELYWDGADWNIPDASAPGLSEEQQRVERVKGTKRLAALTDELRKIRPDLVIVSWNSTANIHLLGAAEQLQLSDNWSLPLGLSELARQQQFYAATYHLPYYSIWGDWYSLTYKENDDKNLDKPLNVLSYAEMSMIGAGGMNAGASLDLTKISPELRDYLRKLFGWRKKFEEYFQDYQHIFDYPSETQVYGEGHLKDGKGFLLLNNPTTQEMRVTLPLSSSELELDPNRKYKLDDWTNLTTGVLIGQASPDEGVQVTIPPRSVKIIGIDIN